MFPYLVPDFGYGILYTFWSPYYDLKLVVIFFGRYIATVFGRYIATNRSIKFWSLYRGQKTKFLVVILQPFLVVILRPFGRYIATKEVEDVTIIL